MIAYIKGTVEYCETDSVVLDRDGMGYMIKTPTSTAERLGQGEVVTLYTHMYVREDVIALYGFSSREELKVFTTLLGISGIGPKVALAILSTLTVEELYYAVFSEDVKAISKTPGIGPKGAKRMIIELKDKLKLENLDSISEVTDSSPKATSGKHSEAKDTIDALVALGYASTEAYKAVHAVEGFENMTSDQLIKASLKYLL